MIAKSDSKDEILSGTAPGGRAGRAEVPPGHDDILHVPAGTCRTQVDGEIWIRSLTEISFRSYRQKRGGEGSLTNADIDRFQNILRMVMARL